MIPENDAPPAPTTDVPADSVIGKIELESIEPVVLAGEKLVAAGEDFAEAVAHVPVAAASALRAVMARYEHDIIGQAHFLWHELHDLLASAERPA